MGSLTDKAYKAQLKELTRQAKLAQQQQKIDAAKDDSTSATGVDIFATLRKNNESLIDVLNRINESQPVYVSSVSPVTESGGTNYTMYLILGVGIFLFFILRKKR
jgi:hypothetical protein